MRQPNDFYETAPWQVNALVDNLPELAGTVWCPCVGDWSLVNRLCHRRPNLTITCTNDLDTSKTADFHGDATDVSTWITMKSYAGQPDWIVDNPPFNVEMDILKHAWDVCKVGVAFMARVSFAEPTRDRGPWLADHPYQKRITMERYSFTRNGKTDSATTDWLV